MKIKKKLPGILGDIILLITAVFCVLPFIYMLLMSLKSTVNAYDFSISLSEITLEQYVKIFTKNHFFRYLLNSMIVAFGGVGLSLLVSCLAGYSFAKLKDSASSQTCWASLRSTPFRISSATAPLHPIRRVVLKFRGNDKIFFFLMMTMVVPSEVIIVPLYLIVRGFDWINTFKALILPLPTAFGVFIMRQAIIGVPKELIESAKIDGAGDMKILWKVILPLVKSAMMTLAIFTFVGAWNNFLWPLIATTEDAMRTLPLAISTMRTAYDTDVGLVMAGAAVTFLPQFLFYLILQSKFEEGITISGMTGTTMRHIIFILTSILRI